MDVAGSMAPLRDKHLVAPSNTVCDISEAIKTNLRPWWIPFDWLQTLYRQGFVARLTCLLRSFQNPTEGKHRPAIVSCAVVIYHIPYFTRRQLVFPRIALRRVDF